MIFPMEVFKGESHASLFLVAEGVTGIIGKANNERMRASAGMVNKQ